MVLYRTKIDPYTRGTTYYECVSCSYRVATTVHLASCPKCGGTVQNIAVSRE